MSAVDAEGSTYVIYLWFIAGRKYIQGDLLLSAKLLVFSKLYITHFKMKITALKIKSLFLFSVWIVLLSYCQMCTCIYNPCTTHIHAPTVYEYIAFCLKWWSCSLSHLKQHLDPIFRWTLFHECQMLWMGNSLDLWINRSTDCIYTPILNRR